MDYEIRSWNHTTNYIIGENWQKSKLLIIRVKLSHDQVWQMIREISNVLNVNAFLQLADDIKKQTILALKERQTSLYRLERLTGIEKGVIHRI